MVDIHQKRQLTIVILAAALLLLLVIPYHPDHGPLIGQTIAEVFVNRAPYFLENLSNYTVNQNLRFELDVNCTDPDGWEIIYYDNTSFFDINSTTGNISWLTNLSHVGTHTFLISCSDRIVNVSQEINVTVTGANNPPVLAAIGTLSALTEVNFRKTISATDPDDDNLTYSANTTLFYINPATGFINFTPTLDQVGNYTINFSVTDGNLTDSELVTFIISLLTYCGDSRCLGSEDCTSCPSDCGQCPTGGGGGGITTGGTSGGGGGGGGGGGASTQKVACYERWYCDKWELCTLDNFQKRECKDVNQCGTARFKPKTTQECVYVPTCFDGVRNGDEEGVDCGGSCEPCPIPDPCTNGILDEGELDIDCGGSCEPCEITRFATTPIIERAMLVELGKKFPWIFLLIILLILVSTYFVDYGYRRHIRSFEFEDYMKKIRTYRKMQKKMYLSSSIASVILLIYAFYFYVYLDCVSCSNTFLIVIISFFSLLPIVVAIVLKKLQYVEYVGEMDRARLNKLHLIHEKLFNFLEDHILYEFEYKAVKKYILGQEQGLFAEKPLSEFNEIFKTVQIVAKDRKGLLDALSISSGETTKIIDLMGQKSFLALSKEYPEFKFIWEALKEVVLDSKKGEGLATIDHLDRAIEGVNAISKDIFFRTLFESKQEYASFHNALIDIFTILNQKIISVKNLRKQTMKSEQELVNSMEGLTQNADLLEQVKLSNLLATMYNTLVDLYDYYKKRIEYVEQKATNDAEAEA